MTITTAALAALTLAASAAIPDGLVAACVVCLAGAAGRLALRAGGERKDPLRALRVVWQSVPKKAK